MSDSTVTRKFVERTEPVFSQEDPLVRAWIADRNGVPAAIINDPRDYNRGALANLLEYLHDLALTLRDQTDMRKASGEWLDLILHTHIGLPRHSGESNEDWVKRVQDYILAPKLSPAAIIAATRKFSSTEPVIQESNRDAAFAGLSFAGVATRFRNTTPGKKFDWIVFPALARNSSDSAFSFTLVLGDLQNSDLPALFELMERWVHPGIEWRIEVIRT